MIITFLGVYIVILGLITLTLFQGYTCVRNINCELLVLNSCLLYFKRYSVVTYFTKITHDMIYVMTGVYSRELTFCCCCCWSSVWVRRKLKHLDLLRHYECHRCLHDGTIPSASSVHVTFRDLDYISRSQRCVLVQLSRNFVGLRSTSSR